MRAVVFARRQTPTTIGATHESKSRLRSKPAPRRCEPKAGTVNLGPTGRRTRENLASFEYYSKAMLDPRPSCGLRVGSLP